MYKFIIKIIISLTIIGLVSLKNEKLNIIKTGKRYQDKTHIINKNNDIKGSIIIKKIKLHGNLYDINNISNNIEKNITIKDINETTGYFLIMAHSGTGPKAFFKDLKYLGINDNIIINYNNITYDYHITNIERQQKNGTITIKKNPNTLILTTCDNDKQLIIYAKK